MGECNGTISLVGPILGSFQEVPCLLHNSRWKGQLDTIWVIDGALVCQFLPMAGRLPIQKGGGQVGLQPAAMSGGSGGGGSDNGSRPPTEAAEEGGGHRTHRLGFVTLTSGTPCPCPAHFCRPFSLDPPTAHPHFPADIASVNGLGSQ